MAEVQAGALDAVQYADRLLGGVHAWTRARQARALARLCETFGDGRVEAICRSALACDLVDFARVHLATALRWLPGAGRRELIDALR